MCSCVSGMSSLCFQCTQQHFLLLIPNFYPSCSACSVGCVTCQRGGHLINRRSLPISWICHFAFFSPSFSFSKLLCPYPTVKPWSDTSRSTQLSVALRSGTRRARHLLLSLSFLLPSTEPKKRQCKVLFEYNPVNEDELELKIGDIVDILEEVLQACLLWDGWLSFWFFSPETLKAEVFM